MRGDRNGKDSDALRDDDGQQKRLAPRASADEMCPHHLRQVVTHGIHRGHQTDQQGAAGEGLDERRNDRGLAQERDSECESRTVHHEEGEVSTLMRCHRPRVVGCCGPKPGRIRAYGHCAPALS